ncbi:MAG: hypothetical protein GF355_17200 [Candidatus Eisenbacteria bacterium]|nr:hypothetical protein [Candidatus Eisenbacteria bacterium]
MAVVSAGVPAGAQRPDLPEPGHVVRVFIAGEVVDDESGEGLPRARVRLLRDAKAGDAGGAQGTGVSLGRLLCDGRGRFVLGGLPKPLERYGFRLLCGAKGYDDRTVPLFTSDARNDTLWLTVTLKRRRE